MTPDRREELRRCDDACYRTRTSREIDGLKERVKALESLLLRASEEVYLARWDQTTSAQELLNDIDAILPKTEEVKDE